MLKISPHTLQKVVVIVGPTASGKTALAVRLAEHCNGEIISADSRQVYRGLDIGTDKITQEDMRGIPHHLIDVADPQDTYTAADFVRDADAAIADIASRGKMPIIAGGTLFYIDALLGRKTLAGVPKNTTLRAELEMLSPETLHTRLSALDPQFAKRIDKHNPRRLVRALEIVSVKEAVPHATPHQRHDACIVGLDVPRTILQERIAARLDQTLARGLVEETKHLLAQGVSESRLNEIGLEYRIVLAYLRGEHTREAMRTILAQKIWQYAKRQLTWLKRMENIHWIPFDTPEKAYAIVQNFYSDTIAL